jgi:hypothetical protein
VIFCLLRENPVFKSFKSNMKDTALYELHRSLGQSLQEVVLACQIFGFFVVRLQCVKQVDGSRFFLYGHHCSMQGGSFLPTDRLHKTSYPLI